MPVVVVTVVLYGVTSTLLIGVKGDNVLRVNTLDVLSGLYVSIGLLKSNAIIVCYILRKYNNYIQK
jgi:hypothetical protein